MQYRLISEAEKDRFDQFMEEHPKGHVLQTWEWGEVKAKSGWQPLRLVVEGENGQILAACSILKRPLPARLGCLFYASRGPVLDIENGPVWDFLWQSVRQLAKQHNALFCKIDPDVPESDATWRARLQQSGFRAAGGGEGFEGVQPRHVFRLDIRPDAEELLAKMNQKTRYNIRLAQRKGVVIAEKGMEELPVFYDILTTTATRDHFLIRNYAYFETFYQRLAPKGYAALFMAYYEGQPISGTLAFRLGKKAWYIYGASANHHRNLMPNYLIQWTMIEWAKSFGCEMYDFRGVPGDVPEDHPLYGLVKFKRGFGGDYVSFIGEYDLVFKPFLYRSYNIFEPLYQKGIRAWIRLKKRLKGQKG